MARVDGQRRGTSPTPLPRRARVLWRRNVRGGLDAVPIAVDARGALAAASSHAPELVQFSADGNEMWRRPTGQGPSISGVVLLNDGTRMLVTGAGETVGVSAAGSLKFRTSIDLLERTSRVGLLPLEDGGVALAAGSEVVALDGEGRPRFRVRLPERIQGPLLATRAGLVTTTQSGIVYVIQPGFATRLGELGGDPGEGGVSTPDGEKLFAAVDGQRLAVFDLAKGGGLTRLAIADRSLLGPIVFGRDGALLATTVFGALISLPHSGGSPARIPLESRSSVALPDAGRPDSSLADDIPPPLPDADGYVAFARTGGRLGIIGPDGAVRLVDEPVCASPVALVPAGPHRIAVGCRTGSIVMLGDGSGP
jgi:hypothetical protein